MVRPLLVWPLTTTPLARSKAGSGGAKFAVPSRGRQQQRLSPAFDAIRREFESQRLRLAASAAGAFPELVLVFEVIGTVEDFRVAIEAISELRWLADQLDDDFPPDKDFYGPKPDKGLPRRLYFITATPRGLDEVLSLWHRHVRGDVFPHGQKLWHRLFEQLHDVRPWGREDRLLATGALDAWAIEVQEGRAAVYAEVDLWFRGDPRSRRLAQGRTLAALADVGAEVVDGPALVEGAGVHMLLARLPAAAVRQLADDPECAIAHLAEIRTFRVASQAVATVRGPVAAMETPPGPLPEGTPVIAVLDGMPVENHVALRGRIRVDDPAGLAATVEVRRRNHGTAVCSTVIWGDLNAPDQPPTRPVYARPVLIPDAGDDESAPADRLFLDLIHGAVARLFEGDDPVAPEVAVINLSIGERNRIFDGLEVGPLARLLDYLSWHYKVLFIISAGNWPWRKEEFAHIGRVQLEQAQVRHPVLLRRLQELAAERMLLSPAESTNGLTVGALDADEGEPTLPPNYRGAWGDQQRVAPATYSRIGPGLRRAPKPDVLMPGGREPVEVWPGGPDSSWLQPYTGTALRQAAPGIRVAAPGRGAIPPTQGQRVDRGTSYAAPMLTHVAARASDALDALLVRHPDLFNRAPRAVWLKTLLVHGSSRQAQEEWISPIVEGDAGQRTHNKNRLLDRYVGHGPVSLERVLGCTEHRATVLAGGWLRGDQAHEYRFPLPASLLTVNGSFKRRLVATLTWLSPPWPSSAKYRGAALTLDGIAIPGLSFKGSERGDARHVGAGTVVHLVKHGQGLARFVRGQEIAVQVNCRGDAMQPLDQLIPYSLAVTLEVDARLEVDIYQEVDAHLRVSAGIEVAVPG